MEKFPRSGWAHLNLSLAYLRSGKPREAIAPAERGLIENGVRTRQQPIYWLVLGLAHQRLGETDEARKWQLLAETRIDELDNPCRTSPRKTPEDLAWQEWSHMLLLRDELRVALPRTK